MRDCFVDVSTVVGADGKVATVTKTCKEYIAELESALGKALLTLRLHGLSSTDSAPTRAATILRPSEQCGRFFLVTKLGWSGDDITHALQTGRCIRPKDHETFAEDGLGCVNKEGLTEVFRRTVADQ